MIEKIISGGQTGADQGGLWAAQICKIPTGGWAPKGYRTENGPSLALRDLFGLQETTSSSYNTRTQRNVQDSDGTVVFAFKQSAGSLLTVQICKRLGKPCLTLSEEDCNLLLTDKLTQFIDDYNIKTLNVAGNRESVSPGISSLVQQFLIKMFYGMQQKG